MALAPGTQRADPEGAPVRPERRLRRGPHPSLPREPGGQRNWDYRVLVRARPSFILRGAYSLGFDWEADDFLYFPDRPGRGVRRRAPEHLLRVGGTELTEQVLATCPATWARARADRQRRGEVEQHDIWGEVVDAVYIHAKTRDKLPERVWPLVKKQVELAAERWSGPTAASGAARRAAALRVVEGDVLGRPRAGCAARRATRRERDGRALARARAGDPRRRDGERARRARRLHPALRDDRARRVGAADPAGALPAADRPPRAQDRPGGPEELVEGGLVLRHRPDDPDFAVEGEAFAVCSFWLVAALDEIGERTRPRAVRAPAGLREPARPVRRALDPDTGRHLDNFRTRSPTWR